MTSAAAAIGAVAVHDLAQKQHAILRNFPVAGHLRFLLERFGPELRQYIVTSNDEERPFSRDQRRWVYASAKVENSYFGFGTDNNIENAEGYPIIKHRTFAGPGAMTAATPTRACRCRWPRCSGAARGRRHAFRPASVVNISGMSFGALSGNAVEALNRGARDGRLPAEHRRGRARAVPPQRRRPRLPDRYVLLRLPRRARQLRPGPAQGAGRLGARPRHRGQALAGRQARPRRHAPGGQGHPRDRRDPRHRRRARTVPRRAGTRSSATSTRCSTSSSWWPPRPAFRSASSRRWATSSSGTRWSTRWRACGRPNGRGVDFVNIDGGEGGTGAAPLVFADSVAFPFRIGFTRSTAGSPGPG